MKMARRQSLGHNCRQILYLVNNKQLFISLTFISTTISYWKFTYIYSVSQNKVYSMQNKITT